MPMQWTEVQVPLGGGLDTKTDPKLASPPSALALKNAVFEESGGIQTRLPFVSQASVTNARRLASSGDELLCLTKDTLYSWSSTASAFVSRGTYLAANVTENSVFTRTNEQTLCDRVEKSSVVLYAWLDGSAASTTVYIGATDKTTGTVIVSPTSLGASTTRPRLLALSGQSQVLLFAQTAANTLSVKALDVSSAANLAASIAAGWTTVITTEFDSYYDVEALAASSAVAVWRRATTTSYGYASIALSGSICTVSASTKGRACTEEIAVAVTADGTKVAVARMSSATVVKGDILTSAFVDGTVDVTMDTITSGSSERIAAAFRSVAVSGQFRCYVYVSQKETGSTDEAVRYNWINTAGSVGTAAVFASGLIVGSRAFDYNGSTYLWLAFDGASDLASATSTHAQLQNSYILYRDDGTIHAKAVSQVGGGAHSVSGWLPQVQNTGTGIYAFCGIERRTAPITVGGITGAGRAYADRGPREVILTFDSNSARRCAQLGKTLYITGGQLLQYDGEGLTEVGFHIFPWVVSASNSGAAGNLAAGTYSYYASDAWQNARGERERSGLVVSDTLTATGSKKATITTSVNAPTSKVSPRSPISREIWRGAVNGSTLYLATNPDPTTSGDNGYTPNSVASATISFTDNYADATLTAKEGPVDGLEPVAPPPCTIIAASSERLVLGGIAGNPLIGWYSKKRGDDEIASFSDFLTFTMPNTGGDITGYAFLGGTLVVFKETAIFAMPGDGFENDGTGQNYGPPQLISSDVGATSADLIATWPDGLFFFSQKGWYTLDQGHNVKYVGARVEDYNSDSWNSVVILETKHQIRCTSSSRMLYFDYAQGAWSECEESSVSHSCLWAGDGSTAYNSHWYCTSSAVYREKSTHGTSVTTSLTYRSPWFTLGDLKLGAMRCKELAILGEYRSALDLKVELFRDYVETPFQTKTWTVSPTTLGNGLIVRHSPSIQKMAAISIRITAKAVGTSGAPTGEALKLTGLSLRVGVRKGLHRVPAAQKQ